MTLPLLERRRRRRLARRLRSARVPYTLWRLYASELPLLDALNPGQRCHLRQLAGQFLTDKQLHGVRGLLPDDRMRLIIATVACVPVRELGLDWYRNWREIILYPDSFLVEREEIDEAGVVHLSRQALAGESADRGGMVLSWGDITRDASVLGIDAALIIHECAHKLDAMTGESDGCPPLHRDMSPQRWRTVFSDAYSRLCHAADGTAEETVLDPYGAESPAEFFAVASEQFFCDPSTLVSAETALYEQLQAFYRQDPAQEAARVSALSPLKVKQGR